MTCLTALLVCANAASKRSWTESIAVAETRSNSEFIAELAQQLLARLDVGLGLDAFALQPVNDAEDAPPAAGLGHDHLYRVGRRAVDRAHLGHGFDGVENVDRETAAHEDDEAMSAAQRQRVLLCQSHEVGVVSSPAHEGGPA